VFPVRYELDLYALFRRNSVLKGLRVSTCCIIIASVVNTDVKNERQRNTFSYFNHMQYYTIIALGWGAVGGWYMPLPFPEFLKEK
jgi:hypothetical protein